MSQALKSVDVTGADIGPSRGDHPSRPQSAATQESRGMYNFVDGSGPIFSLYLEMATEEDKKMVEGWAADADGILIFTGLFSAAVASLISVSIQDIRPNPHDTSNFYLANIYQTLADPNPPTISSSLPASPPPFFPPNYAVWANTLLFLSLVISISCALLATLLQQWARRYLKVTQPRYSLHKRARIRAFFFEGVEKFLVPWAVEALPTLLHVSLFLFFAGISVFLWNVNLTIFKSVVSWVGICTPLYGCITLVPIFRHDSPYHTPLSLPAWHLVARISFVTFKLLRWSTHFRYFSHGVWCHFWKLERSYREMLMQGMQRTVEEIALKSQSDIDTRAFIWTIDSLDEDHELEHFFSGLPGFRSSKVVVDPLPSLTEEQKEKLSMALVGLLDVTFSSDLLPEPVKDRRAIICAKACDPAHIPRVFRILDKTSSRYQHSGPIFAEVVQIMRGWGKNGGSNTNLAAAVGMTVAKAQQRDDSWFTLASDELGIQESVLRDYGAHGDSLSLAVLIHITRQQFIHLWEEPWPYYQFSEILEFKASKFNINVHDTSPELQHEFCALWNQIVFKAQNDNSWRMIGYILAAIRDVYTALHQETNFVPDMWDPSSYPLCNVPGHRPDSAPHIHADSASTTSARTVLRDTTALIPASLRYSDTPSSSVPVPLCAIASLTGVPTLDNFHPEHQKTIDGLHIPVTSPDSVTTSASATRDVVALGITTPHPTPGTSSSAPPTSIASTSPPSAIAFQRITDHRTSSNILHVLSPSPASVLNNMLPTGPQSSSDSPVTISVHTFSSPESHLSPLASAAPNPSRPRLLSSVPSLETAEGC
ncbi:hypothetical protein EDB87DRAFT_1823795 [Lactarius vividus]|nr:hypothetical protein EDB87DRAFT_1823795 [Lactarius vividus]